MNAPLSAASAGLSADLESAVTVVGTGVVGLAFALGCAQRGLSVMLVGPAPAEPLGPDPDTRIYAVSPAAIHLLEQLRAWQMVRTERVCAVDAMRVFGDGGGKLCFDARLVGVDRLATIVEESELRRILWLACRLTPGVSHMAQSFVGAERDRTRHAWRVRLDGKTAGKSSFTTELLVGADGRQSSVRTQAGIPAQVTPYGQTAVVANVHCTVPHGGIAHQWFTGQGIVALLPLPGLSASLVWSIPDAQLDSVRGLDDPAFVGQLQALSQGALGTLGLMGGRHEFPLTELLVKPVVAEGVVLVGDAAHGIHPLAGQGLNLGLQDVEVFLRELDRKEAWRRLSDPVWLRRYERRRAEPTFLMRRMMGGLAQLFGASSWAATQVRNQGMSLVNGLPPLKHALIRHAMGQ
jgi:ubiquinone biosynthesis UbiH/UbiF/VisC/COQ6 family hydroxylase